MRPLIAGNWKMNTDLNQGVDLVLKLRELVKGHTQVDCVIAPPFTAIHHLSHLLADSHIDLCAQDIFWEKNGAYTGEVSGEMLVSVGCKYVIIGHSERRQYFGETDETVNKKVMAALRHGRPVRRLFRQIVAVEQRHPVVEIRQHAAGTQARDAGADDAAGCLISAQTTAD